MSKFSLFGFSDMTRIVIMSLRPEYPKYDSSAEVSHPMSEKKNKKKKNAGNSG